jgi:hypothetical protein
VTPQYCHFQCHLSIISMNFPPPYTVVAMLDCQYAVHFPSFQTRPDNMQTVRRLVVCQRTVRRLVVCQQSHRVHYVTLLLLVETWKRG